MRVFIAYRHTGADPRDLGIILVLVRDVFLSLGIEVSCTFFEEGNFQKKKMCAGEKMSYAFAEIKKCDLVFVLQISSEKSEGMILEVGYCHGTKTPLVIATHSEVQDTYLPEMSPIAFRWSTLDGLREGIRGSVAKIWLAEAE